MAFLLLASDLAVVLVEVAAHLFVLGLDVLEVLFAGVEIVLPPARVIPAIARIQYKEVSKCLYISTRIQPDSPMGGRFYYRTSPSEKTKKPKCWVATYNF